MQSDVSNAGTGRRVREGRGKKRNETEKVLPLKKISDPVYAHGKGLKSGFLEAVW
jgi:hypothetical protein